ncbi:MAG: hypothetical protein ACRDJU_12385 [Actinomycetota bacterium]
MSAITPASEGAPLVAETSAEALALGEVGVAGVRAAPWVVAAAGTAAATAGGATGALDEGLGDGSVASNDCADPPATENEGVWALAAEETFTVWPVGSAAIPAAASAQVPASPITIKAMAKGEALARPSSG